MKLLIDTNIVIAVEDIDEARVHVNADRATALLGLAAGAGHELWISKATHDDLSRARTEELRHARQLQLRRYRTLERIVPGDDFTGRAGYSVTRLSPNDTADLEMLAALDRGAVDLLVTEDGRLRGHADQVGLGSSALSIADAHALITDRSAREHLDRPTVSETVAYAVDSSDPIFGSLRDDYGDHDSPFDAWWDKCQREHRACFTIDGSSSLDALCVLNHEEDDLWGLPEKVLKICLFKVAEHAMGAKRGELLLDAVLHHAAGGYASVFVEVFPQHDATVALFTTFGFEHVATTTANELVLAKHLRPGAEDADLDPWEFHRRFGPPALKVDRAFVIPVIPMWHDVLFPELAPVLELFGPRPPGNAITKAYLSRSRIITLQRGDTVLFYRSHIRPGITVAGVVERVVRTGEIERVLSVAGNRTVYTETDVAELLGDGELLVVLFRRDRPISPYWPRVTLEAHGVLNGPPQSITQVRSPEGLSWLRDRLNAVR